MANGIEAVATAETFPHRTWHLPSAVTGLLRFCRRKPLGALGGLCVLAMLVMAAGADVIAHYAYDQSIPGARMQPPSANDSAAHTITNSRLRSSTLIALTRRPARRCSPRCEPSG